MEAGYHGNFLYDTLIDMYVKRDSAGMISERWRKLDTSNLISLCVAIHQEEGYKWYTVEFVHLNWACICKKQRNFSFSNQVLNNFTCRKAL